MAQNPEIIWLVISFILTMLVFSYLLGDNPVFRVVSALFIGLTAGYFVVVIVYQVLIARLAVPLLQGSRLALVPLLLSGLLLMKLSPRLSRLGNPSMALMVGVGAAVAIGGAVLGTLFGQIKGSLSFFDLPVAQPGSSRGLVIIEGMFFLLGTLATLYYFNFSAKKKNKQDPKPHWLVGLLAAFGKVFIAVTLGAVFAGVLTAAITALIERSDFLINAITTWVRSP